MSAVPAYREGQIVKFEHLPERESGLWTFASYHTGSLFSDPWLRLLFRQRPRGTLERCRIEPGEEVSSRASPVRFVSSALIFYAVTPEEDALIRESDAKWRLGFRGIFRG